MDPIKNVAVYPNANVYFDGKCISHTIETSDGTRKSVGVILPSTLTFSTAAPEIMQIVAGRCRVRLAGEDGWQSYGAGEQFAVPGDSGFDIEVGDTLHYVCHFG
jgi:uncharacterized protein YaiE (UPF0345 family)